jgi:hypothetical protein
MEQDPETSLADVIQVPEDDQQVVEEDPIPNFLIEMNRFRSKIPVACQEVFDLVKESYKESMISFDTLNKEILMQDIQAKYAVNLYFKERIIGELNIPHFEFDDQLNEIFCSRWGEKMYQAMATDPKAGKDVVDAFREEENLGMVAAYCMPKVGKLVKGFESDLIKLFLLEEVFRKESSQIEEMADPHTVFCYSGIKPQKNGSFLDHRYISCYFYVDLDQTARIKGFMIVLFDRSAVLMRDAMLKLVKEQNAKEKRDHLESLSVRMRRIKSSAYMEKMQKYSSLYQSSARYDEKVIQRLFVEMDLDGDGFVGREDLWNYCQAKKVPIKKEVV